MDQGERRGYHKYDERTLNDLENARALTLERNLETDGVAEFRLGAGGDWASEAVWRSFRRFPNPGSSGSSKEHQISNFSIHTTHNKMFTFPTDRGDIGFHWAVCDSPLCKPSLSYMKLVLCYICCIGPF